MFDAIKSLFEKGKATKPTGGEVNKKLRENKIEIVRPMPSTEELRSRVLYIEPNEAALGYEVSDELRQAMWERTQDGMMVRAQALKRTRFDQILADIKQRFAGREVGIRGVLTSLDGQRNVALLFSSKNIVVSDIVEMVRAGTEKAGGDIVTLARVENVDNLDEIPDKCTDFASRTMASAVPFLLENPDFMDVIVPAIIIYDISTESGFTKINHVDHQLPNDPGARASVIMGVYPVDVRGLLPKVE